MNTQGGGTTVYPTDDEVIAAARLARAHDYIERLPEGYNTLLGERGSG